MKSILLATCLSLACARAAERATDFATALETAKSSHTDIALLLHGTGWCKPGERIAAAWKLPTTTSALPGGILLTSFDKPENASAVPKQEMELLKKHLPGVRSYPAIAMFDAKGRVIALCEGAPAIENLSATFDWIKRVVAMRRMRDDDWAAAEKLHGLDKAMKLGQGLDRLSIGLEAKKIYQEVINEMKKADPGDKSGYIGKYTFPGLDFTNQVVALAEKKQFPEAEQLLLKWITNPRLNSEQRQQVCAARFALYQRWP
ncbi:MAG TPA: hypothetical protein VF258_09810, partial [Luteolibacter sp.]